MTLRQLFQWASSNISTITFEYCSTDDYLTENKNLAERFEECRTIPGTRKLHSFIPISTQKLQTKVFSSSSKAQIQWVTSKPDGEMEVEQVSGFITCIHIGQ